MATSPADGSLRLHRARSGRRRSLEAKLLDLGRTCRQSLRSDGRPGDWRATTQDLTIASLGANRKEKPGGEVSARVLFDGTNGIAVNSRTRIRDQERAAIAADLKSSPREEASRGLRLEPALEQMLRKSQICEDLIQINTGTRHQRQGDIRLSRGLRPGVSRSSQRPLRYRHREGASASSDASQDCQSVERIQAIYPEAQLKVDANPKAHGEPIAMPSSDWTSLIDQFRAKYGAHIHENCLPAQSYCEALKEQLADGQLGAETLAQVISFAEEEHQRPEPSRQLGLHLDGHADNPDSPALHLIRSHFDRGTEGQVRHHVQHVASCTDETARTAPLRGPDTSDLVRSPLRTALDSELQVGARSWRCQARRLPVDSLP